MPAASRSRRAVRQLLVIITFAIVATMLAEIHWLVPLIVSILGLAWSEIRRLRDDLDTGYLS